MLLSGRTVLFMALSQASGLVGSPRMHGLDTLYPSSFSDMFFSEWPCRMRHRPPLGQRQVYSLCAREELGPQAQTLQQLQLQKTHCECSIHRGPWHLLCGAWEVKRGNASRLAVMWLAVEACYE